MTTVLKEMEIAEMKADNRISAEDIHFCRTHQTAYELSRSFLSRLIQEYSDLQKNQMETLNDDSDNNKNPYFLHHFSTKDILRQLDYLQESFVDEIVRYFSQKYHIFLLNWKKFIKFCFRSVP